MYVKAEIGEEARQRLTKIHRGLEFVENLEGVAKTDLRDLLKRLQGRQETARQRFAEGLKSLVDVMTNPELCEGIASHINELQRSVQEWLLEASDASSLYSAVKFLFYESPAGYLFNEEDFEDQEIRNIYLSLAKGEGQDAWDGLHRLFRIKVELGHKLSASELSEEKATQFWESRLLIAQLKERTGNYWWALDECDQAIKVCPQRLKPLFKFLRNVILSRPNEVIDQKYDKTYKERFREALVVSEELSDSLGDVTPRYRIQRGYLLWMNRMRGIVPEIEGDPEGITASALKQARNNLPKDATCYRLALCNLANFAIQNGDLRKAEEYVSQLNASMKTTKGASMFYYTRAQLFIEQLRVESNRSSDKDILSSLLLKAESEVRSRSAATFTGRPPSQFAQTLYKKQDRALANFRKMINTGL